MVVDQVIKLNHGSDFSAQFNWPDGSDGNADLTGYTVSFLEKNENLLSGTTVEILNASEGLISFKIDWHSEIPIETHLYFRIQIDNGTNEYSTNRLSVYYS